MEEEEQRTKDGMVSYFISSSGSNCLSAVPDSSRRLSVQQWGGGRRDAVERVERV